MLAINKKCCSGIVSQAYTIPTQNSYFDYWMMLIGSWQLSLKKIAHMST